MNKLDIRLFWGKKQKITEGIRYHPLVCHMIDSASVASILWSDTIPRTVKDATREAGFDINEQGIGYFVALHDLGKAVPPFQVRDSALATKLGLLGFHTVVDEHYMHGTGTTRLVMPFLGDDLGRVLGGHHGLFPQAKDILRVGPRQIGSGSWQIARDCIIETIEHATGANITSIPKWVPANGPDRGLLVWLAGIVVVADWIASIEDLFPYAGLDVDLDDYGERAPARARVALEKLGWIGWVPPDAPVEFSVLYPKFTPNKLQQHTIRQARRLDEQSITVIEVPTGEGKTEAAMYLADTLVATGKARGIYFSLPTQATSDQMFGRFMKYLETRYPAGIVDINLLHGHASLKAEFTRLLDPMASKAKVVGISSEGSAKHKERIRISEWFTYKKRGLLVPFGVGTIDQGLLSILQTKHYFVRLFGLAGKVVIIDEVHAYDAYMTTLLERLLQWLAALHTPVILLSATLPKTKLRALLSAYTGHDWQAKPLACYPRYTWESTTGAGSDPVPWSGNARLIRVGWVAGNIPDKQDPVFPIGDVVEATIKEGGCIAIICSTVSRAQAVFSSIHDRFEGKGISLELFHARFRFKERDAIEQRVLGRFGKDVDESVPRPAAIVVATQVIEQSLDLDFDMMVSDVAPIDLIIQRAGRLHRHDRARPAAAKKPRLWIVEPPLEGGIPSFGNSPYQRHILLLTWLVLREKRIIEVPWDVEPMIERVYKNNKNPWPGLEPAIEGIWSTTFKGLDDYIKKLENAARDNEIHPPGYVADILDAQNNDLDEDDPAAPPALQALTRLAEPTVVVVMLDHDDPLATKMATASTLSRLQVKSLLENSIAITNRDIVRAFLAAGTRPACWENTPLLRYHFLAVLDATGSYMIGEISIRLDPVLGLLKI